MRYYRFKFGHGTYLQEGITIIRSFFLFFFVIIFVVIHMEDGLPCTIYKAVLNCQTKWKIQFLNLELKSIVKSCSV